MAGPVHRFRHWPVRPHGRVMLNPARFLRHIRPGHDTPACMDQTG
ncbi:hypothetical protein [Komagataeibacter intermedius]|nr:hypothetical protein [Komagataeibacter intermedius]